MLLENKSIVITGATKGIGRAAAVAAAKEGALLTLSGRDTAAGEALLEEIKGLGGRAIFVAGDLSKPENCEALVEAAVKTYGGLDGLVNYAGTVRGNAELKDTDEALLDWILGMNFKSCFFTTKAAAKYMSAKGGHGGKGGSIVFMGSLHAYGGEKDRPAYACSKGAMYTFFRHMARNYADEMIRSNWITIGWIATPGERIFRQENGMADDWLEKTGREIMPMGRLQEDGDYVGAILYLLSDLSSQTCGSEIKISGGFTL